MSPQVPLEVFSSFPARCPRHLRSTSIILRNTSNKQHYRPTQTSKAGVTKCIRLARKENIGMDGTPAGAMEDDKENCSPCTSTFYTPHSHPRHAFHSRQHSAVDPASPPHSKDMLYCTHPLTHPSSLQSALQIPLPPPPTPATLTHQPTPPPTQADLTQERYTQHVAQTRPRPRPDFPLELAAPAQLRG